MDGYLMLDNNRRRTLRSAIGCVGVGLHSGRRVHLKLHPAGSGTGIVFRRSDLGGIEIPARYDLVGDTRLCTALVHPENPAARVGTVEHVMAALVGGGIDDAVVELDGPEVPILDGSAAPFTFLIECAGTTAQVGVLEVVEVLRPIRVQDGEGPGAAFVELLPNGGERMEATLEIDFPGTAIGHQALSLRITPHGFRSLLADARTFTLAEEIARLRAAGLAQGGSLANAIVVDGPMVVNPGGLRRPDEFVRHKLLDVVGDLALAGAPIRGNFNGRKSGHALNNRLLRALFADAGAWRLVPAALVAEGAASRLPAAAAPAVA